MSIVRMKDRAMANALNLQESDINNLDQKRRSVLEAFLEGKAKENIAAFQNQGYKLDLDEKEADLEYQTFCSLVERLHYYGKEEFDGYIESEVIRDLLELSAFDTTYIEKHSDDVIEAAQTYSWRPD